MGEASASELNPEPIQDLRAMRGQSVRYFLNHALNKQNARRRPEARRGHGKTIPKPFPSNY